MYEDKQKQNLIPKESPKQPQALVALAEDDAALRQTMTSVLERKGFRIIECSDGAQLIKIMTRDQRISPIPTIDLVITDIQMPNATGLDFLQEVEDRHWNVPVIVITAFGDNVHRQQIKQLHPSAIFGKPFDIDDLVMAMQKLICDRRAKNVARN